jgi:hypothetical protein
MKSFDASRSTEAINITYKVGIRRCLQQLALSPIRYASRHTKLRRAFRIGFHCRHQLYYSVTRVDREKLVGSLKVNASATSSSFEFIQLAARRLYVILIVIVI